jgi:DNA-directed RNA polymerase subunit RPC12/RpoP
MLNEPLPCPFCGVRVIVKKNQGEWGYKSASVSTGCEKCGFEFREETEHWSSQRGNYRTDEESLEKLLNRWNTRMGVPRHAE